MSFYDTDSLDVVFRRFFGESTKVGGNAAVTITSNASGSTNTLVTRFYPKGPINILKFGFRVVATGSAPNEASGASIRANIPFKLYKSSAAGTARTTVMATDRFCNYPKADRSPALWGVSSKEGAALASKEVEAGRFLTIFQATPYGNHATAAAAVGTLTKGGSWSFFIDYVQRYDSDNRHNR